jgi:hypothetical protein
LYRILEDFGGHCDCEVLMTVCMFGRIDEDVVIGQETFETPAEYAEKEGWYCKWGNMCDSSGKAKRIVCDADDPEAEPDVKRALQAMYEAKSADRQRPSTFGNWSPSQNMKTLARFCPKMVLPCVCRVFL